jgi:hypothetical protein
MEAFEDCDPAHPDYTAETCDPVTCRIIPTTCGDGVIQDPNDDGVSEQCEI